MSWRCIGPVAIGSNCPPMRMSAHCQQKRSCCTATRTTSLFRWSPCNTVTSAECRGVVGNPGACDSALSSALDHLVVGVRPAGTDDAQPRLRKSRPVLMDRPWNQGCRKAYRSWCVSVTKITPLPTAGVVSMDTWSVACHVGPHAVAPHPPTGNAVRTPVLEVT